MSDFFVREQLEGLENAKKENRLVLNINTEYFFNFNTNWGYYLNNVNVIIESKFGNFC